MNNDNVSAARQDPHTASAIGQTGNLARGGGAAKVFREFKWGLLTLFLLMVVVIGLVYDGGKKKKTTAAADPKRPDDRSIDISLDGGAEPGLPPVPAPVIPDRPVTRLGSGNNYVAPPPGGNGPFLEFPSIPVNPTPHPLPYPDPRLASPIPTPPPPLVPTEKTYLVKSGDTLSGIASTLIPGRGGLKALLDANKDTLPNPDRLRVGMVLKIPAALAAAGPLEPTPANPRRPDSGAEYVVQGGDTLERIARKLFNDGRKWKELYEWNRDQLSDPSRLRAGQVLKIRQSAAGRGDRADAESERGTEKGTEAGRLVVEASAPAEAPGEVQVMSRNSPANFP